MAIPIEIQRAERLHPVGRRPSWPSRDSGDRRRVHRDARHGPGIPVDARLRRAPPRTRIGLRGGATARDERPHPRAGEVLADAPGVARDAAGSPRERGGRRRSAPPACRDRLRRERPDQGRFPRHPRRAAERAHRRGAIHAAGAHELVVGRNVPATYRGSPSASDGRFRRGRWTVVGSVRRGRKLLRLRGLVRRGRAEPDIQTPRETYSSRSRRISPLPTASRVQGFRTSDPRLTVDVFAERAFYAEQFPPRIDDHPGARRSSSRSSWRWARSSRRSTRCTRRWRRAPPRSPHSKPFGFSPGRRRRVLLAEAASSRSPRRCRSLAAPPLPNGFTAGTMNWSSFSPSPSPSA